MPNAVMVRSMIKKSISIPVFTESKGLFRLPLALGARVFPVIYIGMKTACQGRGPQNCAKQGKAGSQEGREGHKKTPPVP